MSPFRRFDLTACVMLTEMSELDALDQRQAVSLAGPAPHVRESGKWKGKRFICGGRANLRQTLHARSRRIPLQCRSRSRKCPHQRRKALEDKTAWSKRILKARNPCMEQFIVTPVLLGQPTRTLSTSSTDVEASREEIMAPRSFWKGYLKLSLVTCRVRSDQPERMRMAKKSD